MTDNYKSRENYNIPFCMKKFDCINIDIKCKDCIKFNKYEERKNESKKTD